jgi:TolB-like protein/Tfp pilus assembly protein PilF
LQFVVHETQAGHADRIKAYSIAVDVFDRDASFDPLLDPVVRIQAGRIRNCLAAYYLTEGADDPIEIQIPKGTYVPRFIARKPIDAKRVQHWAPLPGPVPLPPKPQGIKGPRAAFAAALVATMSALLLLLLGRETTVPLPLSTADKPSANIRGPSLLVLPFAAGTGTPGLGVFAEGFADDLIGALLPFKNVLVFGADSTSAPHAPKSKAKVDYMLKGSISVVSNQIQLNATLVSAKSGRYIWSNNFQGDFSASDPIELRHDIARKIARALLQSDGAIYREEVQIAATRAAKSLSSYECMLRARQYWQDYSLDLRLQVLSCLERAIRIDPSYADARAALAMVYLDPGQFSLKSDPDAIAAGLRMARGAAALAPDNPMPLQALGLAHWVRREPQLSISAYEQALALNPNDSDIRADLGQRYSLVGNWEKGIPLMQEALARNPAQSSWYRLIVALFHYVHERYDQALLEAQKVDMPEVAIPHAVRAMIYAQMNRAQAAQMEVQEILRIDPNFIEAAIPELERQNIPAETIATIVAGFQKAGLPIAVPSGLAERAESGRQDQQGQGLRRED